jgi:hypothetical protein
MRLAVCGIETPEKKILAQKLSLELNWPFLPKRTEEWIRSNYFIPICSQNMSFDMFLKMHEDVVFDKIWKESRCRDFVSEGITVENAIDVIFRFVNDVESGRDKLPKGITVNDIWRLYQYASSHAYRTYNVLALIPLDSSATSDQTMFYEALTMALQVVKEKVYLLSSGDTNEQLDKLFWYLSKKVGVLSPEISVGKC